MRGPTKKANALKKRVPSKSDRYVTNNNTADDMITSLLCPIFTINIGSKNQELSLNTIFVDQIISVALHKSKGVSVPKNLYQQGENYTQPFFLSVLPLFFRFQESFFGFALLLNSWFPSSPSVNPCNLFYFLFLGCFLFWV